jgi:hypothetical protein
MPLKWGTVSLAAPLINGFLENRDIFTAKKEKQSVLSLT